MAARSVTTRIPAPLLLLAIVEVVILCASVYLAALIIFRGDLAQGEEVLGPLSVRALSMSFVVLLSLVAVGLYQFHQRSDYREVSTRVLVALMLSSLVLIAVHALIPALSMTAEFWAVAIAIAATLILLVRFYFLNVIDENVFRRRTLIYGTGERAKKIAALRRRADRRGFKIVGQIPAFDEIDGDDEHPSEENRKTLSDLAVESNAEEIVIAVDDRRGKLPIPELLDRRLRGVEVIDLVGFLERETGKIPIEFVTAGWLIFSEGFRQSKTRRFAKRTRDLVVAVIGLLLLWPVLLAVAVAIKLEDGWRSPVLYRQQRVGYLGVPFSLIKFRSMIVNAEVNGPQWASENDDRITRVGRILRKVRLDELPQIFNVLRGDMSIVGPRPERPEFVQELSEKIPFYAERHTIKPGITGWAQLRYEYGASEDDSAEKLRYDLYYVKNHNLFLDLVIILQTAEIILWGKGAR
ncbi:MAG: TIGR03013 family XrtA/PEP-CTERM system glycosyltransferase [Pseudomonadota bacterium]